MPVTEHAGDNEEISRAEAANMALNGSFEARLFADNVLNDLNATGQASVAIEQLIGSAYGRSDRGLLLLAWPELGQ